jgi:hypothetical protein
MIHSTSFKFLAICSAAFVAGAIAALLIVFHEAGAIDEQLGKLLVAGVSGLGLALAILAYRLLRAKHAVAEPRAIILRAIYRYMMFSLVLIAAGLAFEVYKRWSERPQLPDLAAMQPNAPDDLWNDVLRATQARLFGAAEPTQYIKGDLSLGESKELHVTLGGGECRSYFGMAKPPAHIMIGVRHGSDTTVTALGEQDHLVFGRVCRAKGPQADDVLLTLKMKTGSSKIVLEVYRGI